MYYIYKWYIHSYFLYSPFLLISNGQSQVSKGYTTGCSWLIPVISRMLPTQAVWRKMSCIFSWTTTFGLLVSSVWTNSSIMHQGSHKLNSLARLFYDMHILHRLNFTFSCISLSPFICKHVENSTCL